MDNFLSHWHEWFMLDGAAFNQGAQITAISRSPELINLFVLGMDGQVRSTWFDGHWHEWFVLDGAAFNQGAQISAFSRRATEINLFVLGTDGQVRSTWFDGHWHEWFMLDGAAFNQGAQITAVSRSPELIDVFVLGMDGQVRSTWWQLASVTLEQAVVTEDGSPLGGHVEVSLRADGSYSFKGYMRATGFPSYRYRLQCFVRSADGLVIA